MNRRSFKSVPIVGAVMLKASKIVSILKLMKFTKIFVSSSTLVLSTLMYGWAFGPWFGVGLIAMLFIHEMGHVIALRRKGYPTSLPVFIPFLGAGIFVKDFGDRATEAYIGYGGPLLGSIAAFLCIGAWLLTGSPILLLTAYLGIYLNLFNMLPIRPLDGGRITQMAGPLLKYAAIALLIGYTAFIGEPALLIIWVFALQEIKLLVWWRSALAVILIVVMAIGFGVGLSEQPGWLNIIDLVFASALTSAYVSIDRSRARHAEIVRSLLTMAPDEANRGEIERLTNDLQRTLEGEDDQRPYPPRATRLTWLGIYLGSTATLIATMVYLLDKMPVH